MSARSTAAVTLLAATAQASFDWRSFSCPATVPGCAYTNTGTADQAVSLFFQFEPRSGETSGGFVCKGDGLTYCARQWDAADSGAAGDCFFILGARRQFTCTGTGTVNLIGSHSAQMSGAVLASGASAPLGCTGATCSYTNRGGDKWVGMAFHSSSAGQMTCDAGTLRVCDWAALEAGGGSCSFLLPRGATLSCHGSAATVDSAQAIELRHDVLSAQAPAEVGWNCPNVTYPSPNICDCSYTNPHAGQDLVVAVTSESVTGDYDGFHCYYGSANVCAGGNNRNEQGARGTCWFILPAGATFGCAMQWGKPSFSLSVAAVMNTTLFPADAANGFARAPRAPAGMKAVPRTGELAWLRSAFEAWKAEQAKAYPTPAEEAARFANFVAHVAVAGRKAHYNSLADLSREEFETKFKSCAVGSPAGRAAASEAAWQAPNASLPASADWRQRGVVTEVKNQGQCGSCWSYSTTGVIESAWAIAGNTLVSLSEQQLVSCDNRDGNAGCNGGWPDKAIEYVAQNGIATEANYPYVSGGGQVPACRSAALSDVKVRGHRAIASNETDMAAFVASNGPLSICVDAMTTLWWPYTDGILTGCCNHVCDHAVLIVGYGTDNGTDYWIIKNSWGAGWGLQGYVKLERGSNQCGITTAPVAALV